MISTGWSDVVGRPLDAGALMSSICRDRLWLGQDPFLTNAGFPLTWPQVPFHHSSHDTRVHDTGRRSDHIDHIKEGNGHLRIVVGSEMHLANVPVEEANRWRTRSFYLGKAQIVPICHRCWRHAS